MTSTAIPVQGDRDFIAKMRVLAAQHETTMAILVRKALENTYGEKLDKAVVFVGQVDDKNHQNDGEKHA